MSSWRSASSLKSRANSLRRSGRSHGKLSGPDTTALVMRGLDAARMPLASSRLLAVLSRRLTQQRRSASYSFCARTSTRARSPELDVRLGAPAEAGGQIVAGLVDHGLVLGAELAQLRPQPGPQVTEGHGGADRQGGPPCVGRAALHAPEQRGLARAVHGVAGVRAAMVLSMVSNSSCIFSLSHI